MGLNLKEDELMLALYVSRQIEPGSVSEENSQVQWLSSVLKQLPLYPPKERPVDEELSAPHEP